MGILVLCVVTAIHVPGPDGWTVLVCWRLGHVLLAVGVPRSRAQ